MKNTLTLFKALSDRNRLRIVASLMHYNELCACQITELLQVSGATASRHLSILNASGLTESRKEGRWVYYRLSADPKTINRFNALMDWIKNEIVLSDDVVNDLQTMKSILKQKREDLCRKQRGVSCCPV